MSDTTIETTLETAWREDRVTMARMARVNLPGMNPGALRGTATSINAARDVARTYAGSIASGVVDTAIGAAGDIAVDFGVPGASEMTTAVGLEDARWNLENLEVLNRRKSGSDYVIEVRYDVSAEMNDKVLRIGRDVSHTARLIEREGEWQVEPIM